MSDTAKSLIITFAGDSGDGVQLLGNLFADNVAQMYYDINTLPEFPAEIRAPANTLDGVSSIKIKWGNDRIYTSGDKTDILVAFNAVSFFKYSHLLKNESVVIYDQQGFEKRHFKSFSKEDFDSISNTKIGVDFTKNTLLALDDKDLDAKSKSINKNIYALGLVLFGIDGNIEQAKKMITKRFGKKPEVLDCQNICLKAGYNYGEITEFRLPSFNKQSNLRKGKYLNLTGNQGVANAIIHSSYVFGKDVFFGGYPITPASDIIHLLSKKRYENLTVVQAEDEIAAIGYAMGASFGGSIGVCASSGPGISLKQEAISLAHISETPVLIIDVQRAGPSTGMPTKIEQSDLNMALYGRHGDCPVPVISISSPSDAYHQTLDAIRIMLLHKTPVILLSDAQIAIGSELMPVPTIEKQTTINTFSDKPFVVGGLEKDKESKAVSYDGDNHEEMMRYRKDKIVAVSSSISFSAITGRSSNKKLIISWGSTYNVIREFTNDNEGFSHLNLSWISPLPKGFEKTISVFDEIYVVEMNSGQLYNYLKTETNQSYISITKQKGVPFYSHEIKNLIDSHSE